DGDGDNLRGAVDGGAREAVGQGLADVERLHGRIRVVQSVGPHAGGGQRVGAITAGAGGRGADRRPGIVGVVDVGGVQIAGRRRGARRAVGHARRLHHRVGGWTGGHRAGGGADGGCGGRRRGA